jgi:hypothetical protein
MIAQYLCLLWRCHYNSVIEALLRTVAVTARIGRVTLVRPSSGLSRGSDNFAYAAPDKPALTLLRPLYAINRGVISNSYAIVVTLRGAARCA